MASSPEIPTSGPELYDLIIGELERGELTSDNEAYKYRVSHTFKSLVGHVRNSRYWKEEPKKDDLDRLNRLLNVVPDVLHLLYDDEEDREDIKGVLKKEGLIDE